MAAYVIVNINVHDAERYEDYKRLAAPTVTAHGGTYIVRGGKAEKLEGEIEPQRIVVLEFPSAEAARTWYRSEEYVEAMALRHASASSEMIVVEGA